MVNLLILNTRPTPPNLKKKQIPCAFNLVLYVFIMFVVELTLQSQLQNQRRHPDPRLDFSPSQNRHMSLFSGAPSRPRRARHLQSQPGTHSVLARPSE